MFEFFCYLKFRAYFFNDMYSKKELSLKKSNASLFITSLCLFQVFINSFYNKNKNRLHIN